MLYQVRYELTSSLLMKTLLEKNEGLLRLSMLEEFKKYGEETVRITDALTAMMKCKYLILTPF